MDKLSNSALGRLKEHFITLLLSQELQRALEAVEELFSMLAELRHEIRMQRALITHGSPFPSAKELFIVDYWTIKAAFDRAARNGTDYCTEMRNLETYYEAWHARNGRRPRAVTLDLHNGESPEERKNA